MMMSSPESSIESSSSNEEDGAYELSSSEWEEVEDSSAIECDPICECGSDSSISVDVHDSDDDDIKDHKARHADSSDSSSSCEELGPSSSIPLFCPYWEYTWSDVPITSSSNTSLTLSPSFIQLPQHIKAIRLGVSSTTLNGLQSVHIYCYLNHLEKQMGWAIQAVTCLTESDKIVELKTLKTYKNRDEVLTASIPGPPEDEGPINLTFRFYTEVSVTFYTFRPCDIRLGDQLWETAVKEHMTDVVFLVGDRSFPAHKFLLAARSPVFAVMFGTDMVETRTGQVKVDDADPDSFQQFIRFLYTGQMEEPASEKLGIIADKYNVETLTSICKSVTFSDMEAVNSLDSSSTAPEASNPALFPFQVQKKAANFWKCEDVSITGDASRAACEERGHSLVAFMSVRMSSVNFWKRKPFTCSFILPDQIRFSSGWAGQDASRIVDVSCSSKRSILDDSFIYFTRMMPLDDPDESEGPEPTKQEFIVTAHPEDLPCIVRNSAVPIDFLVCHSPSVPEFRYAYRDWHFSRNLWSSSVNKKWTDIHFQVEDKIFSAHRALLAARCPALIPSGSNDSSPPVRIENVESSVFEDLLHFVYTGELKMVPPREALYWAAVIYEVDLLQRLFEMRQPTPTLDGDISPDFELDD